MKPTPSAPPRLASIDIYRGFVMCLMIGEVLSFAQVSAALPGNSFWRFITHHQEHVEWIGCSLHDLIQPSFSFLVGVALPFSIASRLARGDSRGKMARHALWRSLALILLGVGLRSVGKPMTYWTFEDTLSQIGLGYAALFLLGLRPLRDRWIALGLVVVGCWAAFAAYPLPIVDFAYANVGVPKEWPHLMSGFEAHWNKNSNLAWAFDTWFLNLWPRTSSFAFNGGGYATLSFIPTLGTMILGLIAGGVLRSARSPWSRVKWFAVAGMACLLAGLVCGWLGLCPVVKRIWTPSWVLFSGGWCFLLLAGFYAVADIWEKKAWAFPLLVVGANSIAAYCIAHLWDGFLTRFLRANFGPKIFRVFGDAFEPMILGAAVMGVLWLVLYWMYRRKLFLKI